MHTWGRQLQHHPHVHYIVAGGGLKADGEKWIASLQADWLLAGGETGGGVPAAV
jgi:hypothetical protein